MRRICSSQLMNKDRQLSMAARFFDLGIMPLTETLGRFSLAAPFCKDWRVCLDFSHRLAIIDALSTLWAGVILKVWNHISPTLHCSGPVSPHFLKVRTAARRTNSNRFHHNCCSIPGLAWKRRKNSKSPCSLLVPAFLSSK
jgi:hypothetical protein